MDNQERNTTKIITPQEGFQEHFVRSNVDVVIGGGVLNPQPLDALVLTPYGFKRIGDLQVGDLVSKTNGGVQRVNCIIDKKEKECVEFTLANGMTVQSALTHHWLVIDADSNHSDIDAEEIINRLDSGKPCFFLRGETVKETSRIESYKLTGKKDVRCINVSGGEHLYLTDHYIVTRNCGKAQPLDSHVLTPKGYVRMGDLSVGDIVSGSDGGSQKVLHVYERGLLDAYKITFDDGTTVECCPEHLWTVWDNEQGKNVTIEAQEILSNGLGRYKLPLAAPICFEQQGRLHIRPYLLGRILGGDDAQITRFKDELEKLGLAGETANGLFIPTNYMFAPFEIRLELLAGLFGTDKWDACGCITSVASKKLAADIVLLAKSLGGKASSTVVQSENGSDVFRMECSLCGVEQKRFTHFANIEEVGRKEMRCIVVSNDDHLYITDGFNLTHNSFAAILSVAEPSLDPLFRACFIRRTYAELKSGGSLTDDFITAYKNYIKLKTTEPPRVTFPAGGFVEFRQINDENPSKVKEAWKGAQYDFMYMDELTAFDFKTFSYLLSRNRGKAKWTGKFRGTTNPESDSWLRTFLNWYIGNDGTIRQDREGIVRYFYMGMGETVDDVVWGNSKEEVYEKCKINIDRKLKALGGNFSYKNLIKSFTFYLGRMSENKASISNNMDYAGSVAAAGGKLAQQLVEGNWNVSVKRNTDSLISYHIAESVFLNDERRNNDKWITADLADTGTDNTVILVWDGLHVIDWDVLCTSTPKVNVDKILDKAETHDIPDAHIVFDGIRAAYVNDYIPDAIAFISYKRAIGKYGRGFVSVKDECYGRLIEAINRRNISISDKVANAIYPHKNIKQQITFKTEFIEECLVVDFKENGGKKTLLTKKEMNAKLGKGRSMDVLDPFAMRMFPLAWCLYGSELESTANNEEEESAGATGGNVNIYDDSTWC